MTASGNIHPLHSGLKIIIALPWTISTLGSRPCRRLDLSQKTSVRNRTSQNQKQYPGAFISSNKEQKCTSLRLARNHGVLILSVIKKAKIALWFCFSERQNILQFFHLMNTLLIIKVCHYLHVQYIGIFANKHKNNNFSVQPLLRAFPSY